MPTTDQRTVPKGVRLTLGQVAMINEVLEKRETLSEFLRTAGVKEARRRMAQDAAGEGHAGGGGS